MRQFVNQLIKIPIAMAVSQAYMGNISAIMNHTMHTGPKAKNPTTPVIDATESCVFTKRL